MVKILGAKLFSAVMTPTGLASGGLALICATIATNALYLQGGQHPAPLFVTRHGDPEPAEAPRGDLIVQAVQQALTTAGYYSGPVDGVAGPQTRAAILSFERDSGRTETGQATADLIAAIEVWTEPMAEDEAEAGSTDAEADVAAVGDPAVAAVQSALARAAYGPLTADGNFGEQTRAAIMRFQADKGLPATGSIDDNLLEGLRRVGALGGA
jgi:peptidoglycan hydrolase-like protein with peptidoglycan-binding domain